MLPRDQMIATLTLLGWQMYQFLGDSGVGVLVNKRPLRLVRIFVDNYATYSQYEDVAEVGVMRNRRPMEWGCVPDDYVEIAYNHIMETSNVVP